MTNATAMLSSLGGTIRRQTQHRRTHGSTSWSPDGDGLPVRCVTYLEMTEEPTPPSGESLSNSAVDYEQLGQELLIAELEKQAYDLRDLYFEVARAAKRGEEIGERELRKLDEADRITRDLKKLVEEAVADDRDGGVSR